MSDGQGSAGGIVQRLRQCRVVAVADPEAGPVRIRRMSVAEFFRITELPIDDQKQALVVACVVDEDDRPVYTSANDLREKCEWVVLQRLIAMTIQVNLLEEKDAEKNSSTPP